MIRADLHIHTYYSDGLQSPEDVVSGAKNNGVNLIAVTDHDNALARKEVAKYAKEAGIYAVEGIEISAYEGDLKVHTLGYNLNFDSPYFTAFYRKCLAASVERTEDILSKLKRAGIDISMQEVLAKRHSEDCPLHTMLISYVAVEKGIAANHYDFYGRYLAYGTAGYSRVGRPTPEEAIEVIQKCGGISSIAHPGRISAGRDEVTSLILRLKSCGLNGIEGIYSGHTVSETQYYKGLAERLGLYLTGGSDTHFKTGSHVIGTPAFYPDERLLSALGIN